MHSWNGGHRDGCFFPFSDPCGLRGSAADQRVEPCSKLHRRAASPELSVMQKLKAFIHDAKQHVTSCIPISPSRAAAGSATLDENAAPEPRPTQATPASAASPVQPAASASAASAASAASPVQPAAAAAAGPVQPASSIVVGSQVIRGPDWKWGKQVCRRVARHASAHACCMRACAHLRLRSRARLPRAGLLHRAVSLRLDASSG
jgi:hypothetical protein